MGYFPPGHQTSPLGSCHNFPLEVFFATHETLASDSEVVFDGFHLEIAPDVRASPVLPFRLVAERKGFIDWKGVIKRQEGIVVRRVSIGGKCGD